MDAAITLTKQCLRYAEANSSQEDDRKTGMLLLQNISDFVAPHFGHVVVEEHGIHRTLSSHLDARKTIVSREYLIAVALKQ